MALLLNANDTVSRSYSYTIPSPNHVSEVKAVGDRTGNLFDNSLLEQGGWKAAAGTIPAKLLPGETNYTNRTRYNQIIPLLASTLSLYCPANIKINYVWIDANGISLGGSGFQKNGDTSTAPEQAVSMTFILGLDSDIECTPSDFSDINVVAGSIAPESYEPYGYKIPVVTSADGTAPITTPIYLDSPLYKIEGYADRLSTTEEVRIVKELVLTGEENFSYDDTYTRFTLKIPNARATSNRSDETPCTHYISIHDGRSIYDVPDDSIYVTVGGGYVYINIKDITYTSLADFKSYLADQYAAGTPVKVYYVMQTPETKPVEPVDILTLNGTTVIDVDTAVKPTEMYTKYKSSK